MLVLQRNRGDQVFITGPDGQLLIVKVVNGQGRIKLGFDAPLSYKILRDDHVLHDDDFDAATTAA